MAATTQNHIAQATLRHARVSPQKARLVLNLIKGKQVEPALQILQFSPKKVARFTEKLLKSAIANARDKAGADVDKLWVTGGYVGPGSSLKRIMPRAHGRADGIVKRTSHITIFVGEK